ncbi:MAG: hypothetical protein IKJ23_00185 [Bacteroidaceae bacterium]|nr:hypothetical protein [Bacteroidaceae bacterium]
MGDNYKHKRNGGNNSLKMIFDPYKESSYVNSDSIETFESCGIIPNCIMGYNGAIYDSQTHNIYIYKISAITAAIKYNGIYKFPTDDTNAIRYAAAFYDKNVFNHLTSVSNKEYKPTDGNKISYFVHSFGCITNLQAANNALDWLVVPRELFNSEI